MEKKWRTRSTVWKKSTKRTYGKKKPKLVEYETDHESDIPRSTRGVPHTGIGTAWREIKEAHSKNS